MKTLQKMGGIAALLMAAAYVAMMLIFIVVLNYATITDPAQKIAMLVDQPDMFFLSNLFGYVLFGVLLGVLCLALYDRLNGFNRFGSGGSGYRHYMGGLTGCQRHGRKCRHRPHRCFIRQ